MNNVGRKRRKKTKSVGQGIGPAQTRSMAMVKARLIPYPRTHPVPPAAKNGSDLASVRLKSTGPGRSTCACTYDVIVCVCVCVCACVRECVRACVSACVCVCERQTDRQTDRPDRYTD